MLDAKPLRSLLFVPGNKSRMLTKARTLAADAIILDLEDGVPPDEKDRARGLVCQALADGAYDSEVVLRVNALPTGLTETDLEMALVAGVAAICLPKAETVDDVERVSSWVATLEGKRSMVSGSVKLLLMIESALGIVSAYELALASPRIIALCLGGEDLSNDLGAIRTKEGQELSYARARLVVAARAAGVRAIDTVYTDLADPGGLAAETRFSRQLGYSGKLLIHPNQIGPVHHAFAPSEEEVAHARRILEAFEDARARGEGVVALDNKMIDAPVAARAREVLMLAQVEDGG